MTGEPLGRLLRSRGFEIADDTAAALADCLLGLVARGVLVAGTAPLCSQPPAAGGESRPGGTAPEGGQGPHAYNMGPSIQVDDEK